MNNIHAKRDLSWLVEKGNLVTSSIEAAVAGHTVQYTGGDGNFAGKILLQGGTARWANAASAQAALLSALTPRRGRWSTASRTELLRRLLTVVDIS